MLTNQLNRGNYAFERQVLAIYNLPLASGYWLLANSKWQKANSQKYESLF